MKENKFRAWDNDKKEFIYFYLFGTDQGYHIEAGTMLEEKPVMQYIGIKDKNGREIYESDIVSIDDRDIGSHKIYVGEIYYCTDYTLESNPCFACWGKNGHSMLGPSIEVIGNIYQNPELLV